MLDVTRAYGLNFLFPEGDTAVGRSLREHGEFGRPEVDLIAQVATAAFVDVGANIGAISLPVAARRPDLTVVAAEGHRGIAGLLAANVFSNHLGNVEVHHVAVGPSSGLTSFPTPPLFSVDNFGETSLAENARAPMEPVRMTTLDELAPEAVTFVKVDVEGYEPQVLAGATRTLRDRRPAWLLEVTPRRQEVATQVFDTLRAAGYRLFWFYSPFSTSKRTKPHFIKDRIRGDISVFATDRTPPMDLRPIGQDWPTNVTDFPHLTPYYV